MSDCDETDQSLDLSGAAIDKEFDSSDEARVIGSQEKCCASDFCWLADSAHRNQRHELLFNLLRNTDEHTGVNGSWAENVHADLPRLEINRPGAREGTNGALLAL
jgi:hypothetical protein